MFGPTLHYYILKDIKHNVVVNINNTKSVVIGEDDVLPSVESESRV